MLILQSIVSTVDYNPQKCKFRDPATLKRCSEGDRGEPCRNYKPLQPPMKCKNCKHVHRDSKDDVHCEEQPDVCEYIDGKTRKRCNKGNDEKPCSVYDSMEPSLICQKCGHLHKVIKDYNDCHGLPCILIMVNKGRLGDTFQIPSAQWTFV